MSSYLTKRHTNSRLKQIKEDRNDKDKDGNRTTHNIFTDDPNYGVRDKDRLKSDKD